MKVIIIEDEKPAIEKLKKGLEKLGEAVDLLACLSTVQQSIHWLQNNPAPELIFMDIELSDGLSFKIIETANIQSPIVFTTAYDEYWQEAFEHNGIDYLLKPVKQEKLEAALSKYQRLRDHFATNLQSLLSWQKGTNGYKKKFLLKKGNDYVSIKAEDVAYFYATHKVVFLVSRQSQKYIIDESLSEIEALLDPSIFYRVNRKYLVNVTAIERIRSYPKSKLQLDLIPKVDEEILIAQENVAGFKLWMGT